MTARARSLQRLVRRIGVHGEAGSVQAVSLDFDYGMVYANLVQD